jgi:hypothetical protein
MLIGLIVVIVAGIAITNSFYQYVYPISIRPAVMIEYIDLIEAGNNDVFILNLKNIGNVPVDVQHVVVDSVGDVDCRVAGSGSCYLSRNNVYLLRNGDASVTLTFFVPSIVEARNYVIIVSAQDSSSRIKTTSLTVMVQDFKIDVVEDSISGKVGSDAQVTVKIIPLNGYRGNINLSYQGGVGKGKFNPNPVSVNGQDKEAVFTFKIIGPPGEKMVTVTGIDEDDIIRSDNFKVNAAH